MTRDRDFKRLVRNRMRATGETYTAARAALLDERPRPPAAAEPVQEPAQAYYDKTVRTFFDGPRLRSIPVKQRALIVVLRELLKRFQPDTTYAEREVSDVLLEAHEDFARLRRELINYRFMTRENGQYRVSGTGDDNQIGATL